MKLKLNLLFLCACCLQLNAQLNIPAHFALVKEGIFKEFSRDSSQVYEQKVAAFYMYRFEVSGMDYLRFLRAKNKQIPKDLDLKRPVVNVAYSDAQAYCRWLQSIYKLQFRLPTKEEWAFAARGGNFDNDNYIYHKALPNESVVYMGNSNEKPKCTSCMQPNDLGIYGMVGNVWEWTEQQLKGFDTFIVGGSFFEDANHVKVTTKKAMNMDRKQKDLGFRMVVDAKEFELYLNKKKKE
jgi:sulfatase modifying factor 1